MSTAGEEDLGTLLFKSLIQKLHQLGSKISAHENGVYSGFKLWTFLRNFLHNWEGDEGLCKCDTNEVFLQKICTQVWQLPEQGSQ